MIGFDTQVGDGMYHIQFETDNKKAYMAVQSLARQLVDYENAEKVAASEMEKTTHTEHFSACGGVCSENTEVQPNG